MRYYLDKDGLFLHSEDLEKSLDDLAPKYSPEVARALRGVAEAVRQMRILTLAEEAERQLRDRSTHNVVQDAIRKLNRIAGR